MDYTFLYRIAGWILQELGGTLSEEEQKQLDEWKALSPENKALYEKIREQKNFDAYQQRYAQHTCQQKYREFQKIYKRRYRNLWIKRLKYVAVFLLPFLMSWWLLWHNGKKQQGNTPDMESILPGKPMAVLTLPNGQRIQLGRQENNLEIGNGIAVSCMDTLAYIHPVGIAEMEYHTIAIPAGGEYILRLADGTHVWLNSETEIRYPASFEDGERKVFLKGEAYFEVIPDTLHPFVVVAGPQELTVLGTSFCIRAYEDEDKIATTLETGKVQLRTENHQTHLSPGQQAIVTSGNIQVQSVNTYLYTGWRKGKFIFGDQSLKEIFQTLKRWYNIEVTYATPELEDMHFTGELRRYNDIREFLDKMEVLEKVRFVLKGKTVIIQKY